MLVGKRYTGSPNEPVLGLTDKGLERILPLLSISGCVRCGIELVLFARYARDCFELVLGATVFRGVGTRFGGECCNRSQSKDLLGSECDADLRCASDDLKEVNGVGAEIE